MLKMPEKIASERIILLRPFPPTFELAKEIFEKVELSRKTLRDWLPWVDGTKSPEAEYTNWLINWAQQNWNEGKGFAYLIRHKKTKAVLGAIDLMDYNEKHKSAEIGYWLSDDASGCGYMTEAIHALENVAFKKGLNRIMIGSDVQNERSMNVIKRCGYHLEGVLRSNMWDDRWQSFRDTLIGSKLKSEWLAEQKK